MFSDSKYGNRICTRCGQEIDLGMYAEIMHTQVCRRNAPNERISDHKFNIWLKGEEKRLELEGAAHRKAAQEKENKFCKIQDKMSKAEMGKWYWFIAVGMPLGRGVLGYSAGMMEKMEAFRDEMILKYKK